MRCWHGCVCVFLSLPFGPVGLSATICKILQRIHKHQPNTRSWREKKSYRVCIAHECTRTHGPQRAIAQGTHLIIGFELVEHNICGDLWPRFVWAHIVRGVFVCVCVLFSQKTYPDHARKERRIIGVDAVICAHDTMGFELDCGSTPTRTHWSA